MYYYFGGMHWIWWIVWIFFWMFFLSFMTPSRIPNTGRRGTKLRRCLAAFRFTEWRNWLYSAFLVRCFDTPSSAPVPNTIFRTGRYLMIRANALWQGCAAFDE